jgi:hypothetical protein
LIELLIIKSGEKYIRCREGAYFPSSLEKASVFPMEKLEHVRDILSDLQSRGFADISLCKLIVTEEPFTDDPELTVSSNTNLSRRDAEKNR